MLEESEGSRAMRIEAVQYFRWKWYLPPDMALPIWQQPTIRLVNSKEPREAASKIGREQTRADTGTINQAGTVSMGDNACPGQTIIFLRREVD